MTSNVSSRHAHVVALAAVGRDDLATAGGKGANLGELVRAGYTVPAGFVVETGAYAAAVTAGGITESIDQAATDAGGASIRAAFDALALPDELRAAVSEGYAELGGGPVAVRSSATAEDLPGAAFAGQQDTYLNVIGDDAVLDAVRRCWGSLWTERAIAYRRRQGIPPDAVQIAVVVQRMVDAEFAGVMFTANPVTGDRSEVVVDASPGLGEAVVSGLVTPDHYVLDEHGAVREHAAGRREVVIRSASGGGVVREDTPPGAGADLPGSVLADLATLGRSVAVHFGRPQDIEWAYADGRLWLVQARPMTALPPPPLRLTRLQRAFAIQLMDYVNVRPYPLDVSAWVLPGIARMVSRMLADNLGLRIAFGEMLPETDGVVERFRPVLPRPTRRVLTAPARILPRVRRFDAARWTADPRFTRFRRDLDDLTGADLRALDWAALVHVPRRALSAMELITALRVDHFPSVVLAMIRLRLTLKALGCAELFPTLITGARTRTDDTNDALGALAAQVRGDADLRHAFAALTPSALLEQLTGDPRFADFAAAFGDFLAEYGHRETVSPLLLSEPTWSEAPATVLGLIALLADQSPNPAGPDRAALALQGLHQHRLVARTRSGAAIQRMIDAARSGIAMREDTHFHATAVLPVLRRAALECGRRLTDAAVLHDADEIWHLQLEELERIADPAALTPADAERLRTTVARRRAARAELAGVPMISPADLAPPTSTDPDALVSGIGASSGRATGTVRVIRGPDQFSTLRTGEILVCPYTNPAWTPLFQRAAAVVVDSGGLGSHAAIVAREYGIPAVMGTARGTTALADGQHVTVDGDVGRVTLARP